MAVGEKPLYGADILALFFGSSMSNWQKQKYLSSGSLLICKGFGFIATIRMRNRTRKRGFPVWKK